MNYSIITGASRGLGQGLARKQMVPNNHLFCISRSKDENLMKEAREMGVGLQYLEYDLTQVSQIHNLMEDVSTRINLEEAQSLLLINNAGTVAPIAPIEKGESKEIIHSISLNLMTPMLLTSEFIKIFGEWDGKKTIVNISSGAGKKPYYGWSCYCTSKAGLDMFTKCVALEQESRVNGVKILAIAPGVLDTNMQKEIRSTSADDFPQVQRFIKMHQEGGLFSPDYAAEKIIEVINSEEIENGQLVDIRDV